MLKARALLFALLLVSPLVASAQSEKFEVVKVADGVYAVASAFHDATEKR